jgi:hypothetical protein
VTMVQSVDSRMNWKDATGITGVVRILFFKDIRHR